MTERKQVYMGFIHNIQCYVINQALSKVIHLNIGKMQNKLCNTMSQNGKNKWCNGSGSKGPYDVNKRNYYFQFPKYT